MRAEVERHAAIAEDRGSLLCPISHTGRAVIREDVSLVAVLVSRSALEIRKRLAKLRREVSEE
jgi:hypothetical protein